MGAYGKDMLREIKKTMGRFCSMLIITALGAASVVGIQATAIDMRAAADKDYKEKNVYDLQLKSSVGFEEEDIAALRAVDGVHMVMPTYLYDVFLYMENETRAVRTYALPDQMNQVEVLSGRLPENAGECVVEEKLLQNGAYQIGDTILLGLDNKDDYNEVLSGTEFVITGVVASALYIGKQDRGSTALGDGKLSYYLYLHPGAYLLEVYTDVFIGMQESRKMDTLTDTYKEIAKEWEKKIETVGDKRVQLKKEELVDAQQEIDDGWVTYNDGVQELDEELAKGRQELADAKLTLSDAFTKLTDGQAELDEEIADAWAEIEANTKELQDGQKEINANQKKLASGQREIDEGLAQLDEGLAQLLAIAPQGFVPELDAQYEQIYAGLAQLEEAQAELTAGKAALAAAQRKIDDGALQIEEAKIEIEEERAKAQAEIDDGWKEYAQGVEEYEDGVKTLEQEEKDALADLAEARLELTDAQATLDDVPEPEWYTFTREDGVSHESYYQDTLRLQKIGYVFPLVFYLVAILVSLTTMSRMVEEHRTQIGVYKALGYSSMQMMAKYLLYAFSASMIGGILGVAVGSYAFPLIITDAYGYLYAIPAIETPIPLAISAVAIVTAVGAVMLVTLLTCLSTMADAPALLMRPKSPAEGKRVLLERIPFLWNRFGFITKVTARNIFRYKKRFIMTLLGVAGCSALLITAFGLRDSVGSVAHLQYGELINYDGRAYTKEIKTDTQYEALSAVAAAAATDTLMIREESAKAENNGREMSVSLVIPQQAQPLNRYINLQAPKQGAPLEFGEDSVFVSEKLARELKISAGSDLRVALNNGKTYTVQVTGVVENYIAHYMYIAPSLYTSLLEQEPYYNSVLVFTNNLDSLAQSLFTNDDVRAVVRMDDLESSITDSTDALGVVTVVLIILACALALVVLFNLTNINITERMRELATIKVLGFYDMELAMYIYRENGVVTAMGILLGLVLGIFLHGFVLQSAEIDILMFPHIIKGQSYLYAILLSAVFAIFVNVVMNAKLARIDMVESLKSIE